MQIDNLRRYDILRYYFARLESRAYYVVPAPYGTPSLRLAVRNGEVVPIDNLTRYSILRYYFARLESRAYNVAPAA
jgi:hypothetical protein